MPQTPQFPYQDGNVTVLGPEVFASPDGVVISWKGDNYTRQHTPDFTSPLAGRVEVRRPCPYCGDRQMIPAHQYAEHVARLHPDVEGSKRPSTVAVDFDGVVHAYSKGWQDGTIYDPPLHGALEGLTTLMETHAVFIHTTRDAVAVASWLADRGFDTLVDVEGAKYPKREFWNDQGVLLVTDRKLPAVAYIDDRAIRFTNWDQALDDLSAAR